MPDPCITPMSHLYHSPWHWNR